MLKKGLSILLSLVMLLGVIAVLPLSVSAQEVEIKEEASDRDIVEDGAYMDILKVGDGAISLNATYKYGSYYYKVYLDNKYKCEIIQYTGSDSIVNIPKTIDGIEVGRIGKLAFSDVTATSITIPNTVTTIMESAFKCCKNLKSIVIPSSVTSLGKKAFNGCTSLKNISISSSLTYIPERAFSYTAVESITLPNGIAQIGISAFECCNSLTAISFPTTLKRIDGYAFVDCYRLNEVTIPASVTSIGTNGVGFRHDSSGWYLPKEGFIIRGKSGSYAKQYASIYDFTFVEIDATQPSNLSTPEISKCESIDSGVKITWGAVSGAAKYRVYKKVSGSWKKLDDTSSTSYVDKNVKSGGSYTYTVRCINASGTTFTSSYNKTGWTYTYNMETPKISSVTNVSGGQKITWGKISGAAKYAYYVKNGSSWKRLGTTTGTTFTYKKVSSGKKYTYTVRCLSKDGKKFTSNQAASKSLTYKAPVKQLTTPKVSSVKNVSGGQKITWGKVSGAARYAYYVKNGSSWKRLGTTTGTTFTYKSVSSGKKYTYCVRCLSKDGKNFTSKASAGKTLLYLAAPNFTLKNNPYSVTISWSKVAGAKEYKLYYKGVYDGQWHLFKTTTATSYKDSDIDWGDYTYTVKAVASDGTASAFVSKTILRPLEEYEQYYF